MKSIYLLLGLIFLAYLSLPNNNFPPQLSGSIKSFEPADVETPLRQGFYSDLSRQGVVAHYRNDFEYIENLGLRLPAVKLNYPPEDAQSLIRDQARSTFLEEMVHPFRESIFINGFEPKENKDKIVVEEKFWRLKVIVKQVQSSFAARIFMGILVIWYIPMLVTSWKRVVGEFRNVF